MTNVEHRGGLVILFTFGAAFLLTVLSLPEWAQPFRPAWVTLVLIYWCMALPGRIGVGIAWLTGILLDVSVDSLLGQHAMGMAIVAFITLSLYQRTRIFPLWQQALGVLLLLLLENLIPLLTMGAIGQPFPVQLYWGPPMVGMLLWPLVFIALRFLRRRFRVT
jgi:rod shape-determining protein MreD